MKKILVLLLIFVSLHAFSQQYWEDGFWKKEVKKRYSKTGSMTGMYTSFYNNGQIKWQGHCSNAGTPDSIWVYYDRDGGKLWEGNYNGKNYLYEMNEDGLQDTLAFGPYQNGLKEGTWTFKKDEEKTIGYYHNGNPIGSWNTYDEQKKVVSSYLSSSYDYNTQTKITYDESGKSTNSEKVDSSDFRSDFDDEMAPDEDAIVNLDVTASARYLNFNALNAYFIQAGHNGLQSPVYSGGVQATVETGRFYQHYNISYMPTVSAQVNDSVKLNLSAFGVSFNYGGDLVHCDWFNLAPTLGIGLDELELKVNYTKPQTASAYSFNEKPYKVYTNPAPYVQGTLNIRFNIGEFTIGASGGYVLDCSGQKWRYNGEYLKDSPKTSISGFYALAAIGLHID